MATRASKSTAVVPAKKSQVPATLMARFKALAEKQSKGAATLGGGSSFVSLKGGNIVINSGVVPGNKFNAVILGFVHERAYYEGEYDASSPQGPDCYAYGELNGGAPKVAHEKAKEKQCDTCAGCEYSKFGSAQRGRGQACREGVKVAFITADTDPASLAEQPIYMMSVPPTSIKFMKGYLDELGAEGLATSMVETEVFTKPDPKSIFTLHFEAGEPLDEARLSVVAEKLDEAESKLLEPYPDLEEQAPPPRAAKGAKSAGKAKYR